MINSHGKIKKGLLLDLALFSISAMSLSFFNPSKTVELPNGKLSWSEAELTVNF